LPPHFLEAQRQQIEYEKQRAEIEAKQEKNGKNNNV